MELLCKGHLSCSERGGETAVESVGRDAGHWNAEETFFQSMEEAMEDIDRSE